MMIGIMISRVIVCTKLVEVLKSLSADLGHLKIISMNKLFTWAINAGYNCCYHRNLVVG